MALANKLVVITGGARGIGRATAELCAKKGARLALCDVDGPAVEEAARGLAGRAEARAYALDVRDRAAFAETVARIEHEQGSIDVLVNNAGIMPLGAFLDQPEQADRRQIDINVFGVIHGMRAVLPGMQARGRGHVVNVASMAGQLPVPYAAVYSATKHAVVGLTEAVRLEMRKTGVRFSYVLPIPVNTELMAGAGRMTWPPPVEADDVAEAIVRAVEEDRIAVYVPGYARIFAVFPHLVPRGWAEWAAKITRFDRMFRHIDAEQRASYVARTTGAEEPKLRSLG